jgi:uncharacterized membrane protein YoaK (UPF0700 family)
MTGNTVLLGISIFGLHHDVLHPLIALISYAIGVSAGSYLTRNVSPDSIWDKAVSRVLFLEALLLIAAEVEWIRAGSAPGSIATDALLGCIAVAIGLQSGSMLSLHRHYLYYWHLDSPRQRAGEDGYETRAIA